MTATYRDPLTGDAALDVLEHAAGTHFDPDVVAALTASADDLTLGKPGKGGAQWLLS